jgi:hypothetical protein
MIYASSISVILSLVAVYRLSPLYIYIDTRSGVYWAAAASAFSHKKKKKKKTLQKKFFRRTNEFRESRRARARVRTPTRSATSTTTLSDARNASIFIES